MKYLLNVPDNKEAISLLNFLLTSQILDLTEIKYKIPNEITKQAIDEARQKKGEKFDNVKDIMKELNS